MIEFIAAMYIAWKSLGLVPYLYWCIPTTTTFTLPLAHTWHIARGSPGGISLLILHIS